MKEGVQVQVIKLIKKGGKNTRAGCVISEKNPTEGKPSE